MNDAFPVKKIISDRKEIPVQGFAPRISGFDSASIMRVTFCRCKGKESCDFAIYKSLACYNEEDHIYMPQK